MSEITAEKSTRNASIDHAKAIAIILMVLLHTTSRYDLMSNLVNSFHMAIFFIIGGMFSKPENTFWITLKKSFFQLIIPYIVFSFVALSICWISPRIHPEFYPGLNSLREILKAAVIGIFIAPDYYTGYAFLPLGPLWFLLALFWNRLLFSVWCTNHAKDNWVIRIVPKLSVALIVAGVMYYKPIFMSLNGASIAFPFFLIGYYGKTLILKLPSLSVYTRIAVIIICSIFMLSFTDMIAYAAGVIQGNVIIAYMRGLVGSLLLLIICSFIVSIPKLSKLSNYLSIIGASTITILCLHFHFIYPLKVIYKLLLSGDPGNIHIMFALTVSLCIVIVLTYLHGYLNSRIPIIVGKGVKRPIRDDGNKVTKLLGDHGGAVDGNG